MYFSGVILAGADAKSFKKFKGDKCSNSYSDYNDYSDYYIDKNNIYSGGKILSSNPSTFICLGEGWAKDQDNYYFGSESTSFSYQDNIFYFENIVGKGREPGLGGTDTNTYILDKKTGTKKKIFDFGRRCTGGEVLPGIAKTNNPNILEFTQSDGDACECHQKYWYYDILNHKILKIEFLSGCGFSKYELSVNDDNWIRELINYKGCGTDCHDSCQNLKPILKDVTVNDSPQKIFSGKEVLRCENRDNWDANSSINYIGTNSDLSEVYFTISNGKWNEKEYKNIVSKEYKLSYNVFEKRVTLIDDFKDLLILTDAKEPIFY